MDTNVESYFKLRHCNIAWNLGRMDLTDVPSHVGISPEDQRTPSWAAFDSVFSRDLRPVQTVGFFPILQAPVT